MKKPVMVIIAVLFGFLCAHMLFADQTGQKKDSGRDSAGRTVEPRTEGLPVKGLPARGKSLTQFLPGGWTVDNQASGDLNGDGIPDIAAILFRGKPGTTPREAADDEPRALIVLLGRDNGEFTLAGTNSGLLQDRGYGGAKEMVGIGIKKGIIVVREWSGSREFSVKTWRFRYDSGNRRFVLIGKDIENVDGCVGGKAESFNYLTGSKITETFRYNEMCEHKVTASTKKGKGTRATVFLEDAE